MLRSSIFCKENEPKAVSEKIQGIYSTSTESESQVTTGHVTLVTLSHLQTSYNVQPHWYKLESKKEKKRKYIIETSTRDITPLLCPFYS